MAEAPRVRIREIELYERPVRAAPAVPLRRGHAARVPAGVRACAHRDCRTARAAWGAAAEMMAPKWFDKNLALTNEDNFEQLRDVLRMARDAYLADAAPATAFGHFARHYDDASAPARATDFNPLLASYGPALVDRAVLDALVPREGVSFYAAMRANLPGIGAARPTSQASTSTLPRSLKPAAVDRGAPHRRHGRCDHAPPTSPSAWTTACRKRWRK